MNDLIEKDNLTKLQKSIIISKKIREISIPVHVTGYKYIVSALAYMLETKSLVFISDVYKAISRIYGTSYECVEAGIRNAIQKALAGNESKIRSILKISADIKLSNSVFLNSALQIILEEISK